MTTCTHHPQIEAVAPCQQCGRPFCAACLVDIVGRQLCEECKGQVIGSMAGRSQQHPLALAALLVPALGYMATCGVGTIVTSPIGLVLGLRVLRELRDRPYYSGRSLALAGLVVSGGTLATVVIAMVATLVMWYGPH